MSFGQPRTEEERRVIHNLKYGTGALPPRGTGQMLELNPQTRYLGVAGAITKWVYPNLTVTFRPLGGSKTFPASVDVTYNPEETTLTAANLIISIVPKEGGCYFALSMNGVPVDSYDWGFTNDPYSKSINVLNNLKRGANSFDLHVTGARWLIFSQEIIVNISLNLEYIGKEPEVVPPEEQWQKYVPWVIGGGLGLAGLALVIYVVKE